jgi:sortase A
MTAQIIKKGPDSPTNSKTPGSMRNLLLLSLLLILVFTGMLLFATGSFDDPRLIPEKIISVFKKDAQEIDDADELALKEEEEEVLSVFEENLKPIYHKPIRLYTNEEKLDVKLEEVGLEEDGALAVPSDWYLGGWYGKSAKAGEPGNVIIDGHYDTNTGAPAAFWELQSLVVNDRVFLVDEIGKTFEYAVYETLYIDIQDPDRLEQAFSSQSKGGEQDSNVIVITCGGVWIPGKSTYDKRVVVKARLVTS